MGIFGRVYTDASILLEDGDYYQLIGYDDITIEDIASYVILQLDHIPSENEIEEGKEWTKRISQYREAFDNVKSITYEYVRSVDEGLAIRQKGIIADIIGDRNIYLYGDSKYAGICLDVYRDCNIAGIIDRDISKIGIIRKGVKIFDLDKLDFVNAETDVVLITNRRYEEILMSLSPKGWKYNRDCFVLNPRPDIVDYNDIELETYIDEETNSLNTNVNYPSKNRGQKIGDIYRIADFNTVHQRIAFQADNKQIRIQLHQENADELFKKYNLNKERVILIAPYSATLGNVPNNILIRIVNELRRKGYYLCTNVAPEQRALHGTKGLFIPYSQIIDFVNKAGFL